MSDQPVQTMVETNEFGEMAFQEYFVHHNCEPIVKGFRFAGIEMAKPCPGIIESINDADAVVICPSNPWVSIDPILAVPGIRSALLKKTVVAVSPIIGGETIKGPAAKMFREMGIQPSAVAVCNHYGNLLSGFLLDTADSEMSADFSIPINISSTIMRSRDDRRRLGQVVLDFIRSQ